MGTSGAVLFCALLPFITGALAEGHVPSEGASPRGDGLHRLAVLELCETEADALQVLKDGWDDGLCDDAASNIKYLAERGWWTATKEFTRLVRRHRPGVDLDAAQRFIANLRDEAVSALQAFRAGTAEDTVMSPAFQWAQSWDTVLLSVKFSSRIDGPTTVLSVVDERVAITNSSLEFNATGKDKPKRMRLALSFNQSVDAQASSWTMASVGRVSFTLRKAVPGVWPQLLAHGAPRPKNMYVDYERQEALDSAIEGERQRQRLRELLADDVGASPSPPRRPAVDDDDSDRESAREKKPSKSKKAKKKAKKAEASILTWNVSQVHDWLGAAGLASHRKRFSQHEMDGRALADTSEAELKSVLRMPLGDRKRLRLGVCALHPACSTSRNTVRSWSEEAVLQWLSDGARGPGLGHASRAFKKYRVDGAVLVELSDDDLRELGIRRLSDRKAFRIKLCEASSDCELLPTAVASWSSQQMGSWLEENGYGHHRRAFQRHVQRGATLLELSEEDLEELGVKALGLRKRFPWKLCAADASLCKAVASIPDQYADQATPSA